MGEIEERDANDKGRTLTCIKISTLNLYFECKKKVL